MEVIALLEKWQHMMLAFYTQDNVIVMSIALVSVGLIGLLIWLFSRPYTGEFEEMGRPIDYRRVHVELSKKEKKIVLDMATDYLEGQVLFKKMKKEVKQQLYKKLGLAFEIPELVPPGEAKARMLALNRHLNGHKPEIPGTPPIQELKPNNLPTVRSHKDKVKNLFKPAA